MQSFLSSISSNLLTQPAYIIGLLVFVGMVALKRPVYEAVASMVKAVVGYFILSIGSGGFTSTFRPIVNALASKFNSRSSETWHLVARNAQASVKRLEEAQVGYGTRRNRYSARVA